MLALRIVLIGCCVVVLAGPATSLSPLSDATMDVSTDAGQDVRITGFAVHAYVDIATQRAHVVSATGNEDAADGGIAYVEIGLYNPSRLVHVREIVRMPDERDVWCLSGPEERGHSLTWVLFLHDHPDGDQLAESYAPWEGFGCTFFVENGWSFPANAGAIQYGDFVVQPA